MVMSEITDKLLYSVFSFLFSAFYFVYYSPSNSMFWLWAAQCFTPCFMASWPRTRMKSIFQMWNRQLFWQCWSKLSLLSKRSIEHFLLLDLFCNHTSIILSFSGKEQTFQFDILQNLLSTNTTRQMKWISEMESLFIYFVFITVHFSHVESFHILHYFLLAVPHSVSLSVSLQASYSRW